MAQTRVTSGRYFTNLQRIIARDCLEATIASVEDNLGILTRKIQWDEEDELYPCCRFRLGAVRAECEKCVRVQNDYKVLQRPVINDWSSPDELIAWAQSQIDKYTTLIANDDVWRSELEIGCIEFVHYAIHALTAFRDNLWYNRHPPQTD